MIPALSIRQPWAWLIVNGHKDIENRDWPTPLRGRFLVHASKTITRSYYEEVRLGLWTDQRIQMEEIELPPFEELPLGGFVGWSNVVDCVREHTSPWKMDDCYGFVLRDSKPLPFVPYKGRLGFFNVPDAEVPHG